eukprot:jgi/Tetstr1/453213/TSEL_040230.t1
MASSSRLEAAPRLAHLRGTPSTTVPPFGSTPRQGKAARDFTPLSASRSNLSPAMADPVNVEEELDCGFEHPSEVQHEWHPTGHPGHGRHLPGQVGLEPEEGKVSAIVLCHTRELAFQICHEFERFSRYLEGVKVANFFGGLPIEQNKKVLKEDPPHIVVGTPGRMLALSNQKFLNLSTVRHFVLDECDKMLDSFDMRRDVQKIFIATPHDKQVMMFSATLSQEIRPICKKFMTDPMEIYESDKNRKLNDLLDALDFNQVVIFVKSVPRAVTLDKLLCECNFPSITIHSKLSQAERIERYKEFKQGKKRILVATDLVGRGIDIERVNIVINYDMPVTDEQHGNGADTYLHRVGRAGRFGTKGLASPSWPLRRTPSVRPISPSYISVSS